MIDTSNALRLAQLCVEKYSQTTSQPGFIITQDKYKVKVTFSELMEKLKALSNQDLQPVHRCRTCEYFNAAPGSKHGSCFPESHNLGRVPNDYCSFAYKPASSEKRRVDEIVTRKLPQK